MISKSRVRSPALAYRKLVDVEANISSIATASTISTVSLTDPGDIVTAPDIVNKANPDIADVAEAGDVAPTPLATKADNLHRLRNNTTGVTSAQSSSTLGTFAVSPKWDVVAGTQYTISMHAAPLGFQFYQVASRIQGFNTDGSFNQNIVPTSASSDGREATFTVPAGVEKIAINLRNPVDYSNSNPLTEAALNSCIDNIMLNEGATALEFKEYSDGVFTPTVSLFEPLNSGEISVTKQNDYWYVRAQAQQSTSKDVVWRLLAQHDVTPDSVNSRTGVVDFQGIRFIDSSATNTVAAFNQSTDVHQQNNDESCPEKINAMFVAGGHGVIGYTATMVSHGKTNVDVGSEWNDGTDAWILYYINDADNVTLVRKNTGAADKWVISSADFGALTLTHTAGATNTANIVMTASSQYLVVPIIKNYLAEIRVDNVAVTTDGYYKGARVVMSEVYSLMNLASQQDYLIANVGDSTPDYTAASISEQVRYYYEYEWNEFGAMSVRAARATKEAFTRTLGVDYWGGIQLQRVSLVGDSTDGMSDRAYVYIPHVAPVSGLDFEAIAEVTSNVLDIFVPKTSCDDVNDPASHFCLIGRDSAGTTDVTGHLFGYSRGEGLGVPATRAASVATVFRLSPAEKNYPWAIDATAGDGVVGDVNLVTSFRAPFLPTDTDLTVPAVIVTMSGKTYCYITAHQNLTNKLVSVPGKYNGWLVTEIKSHSNVTVNSKYVSNGKIDLSVINSYGDVVLQLGG